jgi:hypothetical protein
MMHMERYTAKLICTFLPLFVSNMPKQVTKVVRGGEKVVKQYLIGITQVVTQLHPFIYLHVPKYKASCICKSTYMKI